MDQSRYTLTFVHRISRHKRIIMRGITLEEAVDTIARYRRGNPWGGKAGIRERLHHDRQGWYEITNE